MKLTAILATFGLAALLMTTAITWPEPRVDNKGTVVFYLSTECPVAASYTSRINNTVQKYEPQGFKFEARFPQASDNEAKLKSYVAERGFKFPCKLDLGGAKAQADQIKIVPTVVVRDPKGRIAYFGAIDDNKVTDLVRKTYLTDALEALVAGNAKPAVPKTDPIGCVLTPGAMPPPLEKVNYAEHVATILNDHCVSCHRPGEVAPFSLIGYENAKNWAPTVASVVATKLMPPWKAVPGVGDFKHENRLTDLEIETIKRWSEAGAPRGDVKKEPKAPAFNSEWGLGQPDMVLQLAKPFKISADGKDEYWHFVLKPKITEPVYVQAVDVKPGNKKIVHHVILWLDEKGAADKVLAKDGVDGAYLTFGSPGFLPDNSFGGWAPGLRPERMPENAGIFLNPGTNVVLEIHYHKSGKEETDQTKVGLYFAKDPKKVTTSVEIAWLANPFIKIKPGGADQKFSQVIPVPVDVTLYSLLPHMHMLGKKMKATLVKPDGTEEPLIQIDDWDWNWQFSYALKEPMLIKKGSKIRIEAVYDNSADNPNNPNNPPKLVTWGEQTTDEMMLLVAAISVPENAQGQPGRKRRVTIGGF